MKAVIRSGVLGVLLSTASGVIAGPVDGPKIAGHLTAYTTKGICTTAAERPPCNEGESHLTTHGALTTSYNLYLLVLDGDPVDGVAGAAFGIEYSGGTGVGIDTYSWILCAEIEYTGGPASTYWPASGSGNMIIWEKGAHCQRTSAPGDTDGGVTAVLGSLYVYAYSDDLFSIVRRSYVPSPDLSVATCTATEISLDFPNAVGTVGFGTNEGVDPCR